MIWTRLSFRVVLLLLMLSPNAFCAFASESTYGSLILEDGSYWKNSQKLSFLERERIGMIEVCLDRIYSDVQSLKQLHENPENGSEHRKKILRASIVKDISVACTLSKKCDAFNLRLKKEGNELTSLREFCHGLPEFFDKYFDSNGNVVWNRAPLKAGQQVELFLKGETNSLRGIDGKPNKVFPSKQVNKE